MNKILKQESFGLVGILLLTSKNSLHDRLLNKSLGVDVNLIEMGFALIEVGLDNGGADSSVDLLLAFFHHHLLERSLTLLHRLIFHTAYEVLELGIFLVLGDFVTKNIFGVLKHLETHLNGSVFNSDARLQSKFFAIDAVLKQPLVAVFGGVYAIGKQLLGIFL